MNASFSFSLDALGLSFESSLHSFNGVKSSKLV